MPAASVFPNNVDRVDDLVKDERAKRSQYIKAAWRYYDGAHKKPLKVREGQPDDNVILNLCKRLVNSNVAMLVGRGVDFEIVEGKQTAAEDVLAAFWRANRKQLLLNDIALSGSVTGQPTVQFVLRPQEPPRLVNIDPELMSVVWDASDKGKVLAYVMRWQAGSTWYRQDIIAPGQVGNASWLVRTYQRPVYASRWQLSSEEAWPYAWPPVLTWKNLPHPRHFYGLSDLESAEINDAINFVASNINRILRFFAHPRTIALGVTKGGIHQTAVEGLWEVPNKDAKIFNLEMKGDLKSSMEYLNFLRGAFFSEGAGVDLSVFKDKIGQITNFGLQVLFRDALDRLELKRSVYGEAFAEINRRALEIAGEGDSIVTRIHWPEALPSDKASLAKLVTAELEGGLVSRETAAAELGLDWTVEKERIQGEKESDGSLGEALMQAFAAGKGAGK